MKRTFIAFTLLLICSITFAKNYTFVTGEPLVREFDQAIFPGTYQFPGGECAAVLAEVKLTGESSGYFRLFVTSPSRELTYYIKVGDIFHLDGPYTFKRILPCKDISKEGYYWVVIDIQDNLITFEERYHS